MVADVRQTGLAEALLADGPAPEHAEALMLFGQFVGEWELDWCSYGESGEPANAEQGEWIFGWVLAGRAVQDVWIIPTRGRRTPLHGEYGTTIRVYDPRLDLWRVTWNGPLQGVRRTLVARRAGDAIVQEGETETGEPLRWIFSEVVEDSFSWRSLSSNDGERTWQLRETMRVRRRP